MLSDDDVARMLERPVAIEEKLDGANVTIWCSDGRVQCALRSGLGSTDRAGQLGPLRAWVAERSDALHALLVDAGALYAEWLLLSHSVVYDRLPAYLVVLDIRRADGTFMTVDERNSACATAALAVPVELWRGRASGVAFVEQQIGPSRYGNDRAEGVVIRTVDGRPPRIAKLLRGGFSRLDDSAWASKRPRNQLADRAASWH